MRWAYDITGTEPIIRDLPVYDGSALVNGELLMLGTTDPDSNADQGISLITAYVSNSANEAADAVGILTEGTYASSNAPDAIYGTDSAGADYGKVIINPFAVYRAEYLQGTSNDVAIASVATTTLTVSSLEDAIDGGWVFFPLNATGVKNSLRFIVASASGSCTMDSALVGTASTADTIIKILPQHHQLVALDTGATGLCSVGAAAGSTTKIIILENYIESFAHAMQPLRRVTHAGLNNLSNAKFYADILCTDHLFNVS